MKAGFILVHSGDDAAVALANLKSGETYDISGQRVTLRSDIPFGHKVALREIKAGENIIKYGSPIGHALCNIHIGDHIHTHNLKTNLDGHVTYQYQPNTAAISRFADRNTHATFEGYPRADGRAGTRNELWIVPTVGCVNTTAVRLAAQAKAEFGGRFDDICAYTHNMGCSQLGDDQATTMKLLAGLIHNPNAGGVLVLSLGCENNNLDVFRPYLGEIDESRVKFLVTQDTGDEYEAGMALLRQLNEAAGGLPRQTLPASKLVIGFKCGGSDAFSGVTANPLCGRLCDRLVQAGGSCILTEVPEMFGAEHLLMARCMDQSTFDQTVSLINTYKDYFTRHGQVIYENPSPGNKAGGISSLEEKSLGCVQKGGSAPVVGVLNYGDPVTQNGLNLLTGSGNDQVSCTNLTCSGATVLCFTTGRGNPFGAPVPTIKVASNSTLAARKPHWIDFNAGRILDGADWDTVTDAFFRYVLDVASGRITSRNEDNGYKEISIFRDGVIL